MITKIFCVIVSGSGLAGWFWLRVSHAVAVQLLAEPVVIAMLCGEGDPQPNSFMLLMAGSLRLLLAVG